MAKYISQRFSVSVYRSAKRFCIPAINRRAMGLRDGMLVHLRISSVDGELLFNGIVPMKSGPEFYGYGLADALRCGQYIHVMARRVLE